MPCFGLCKGLRSVHQLVFGFMALLLRGILKPSWMRLIVAASHAYILSITLEGLRNHPTQMMNWSVKHPISLRRTEKSIFDHSTIFPSLFLAM